MGFSVKIHNFQTSSENEEKIIKYFQSHELHDFNESVHVLADKIGTSAASLIRFSKKLGYRGFSELKLAIAIDQKTNLAEPAFSEKLSPDDSLEVILQKNKLANQQLLDQTYDLIDSEQLQMAIEQLRKARRIFLFGIGASGICCLDLSQKLSRIGAPVVYHLDSGTQFTASTHISSEDVVIAVSYSGNTRDILASCRHAKSKGSFIIAITQFGDSPLQKIADSVLSLPRSEYVFRLGAMTSRNATFIYTDLLYLGLITEDLDFYKERLAQTLVSINDFY